MDIFKGKITVAGVARQHDLTVSEVEGWIDEAHLQIYALKKFRRLLDEDENS